MNGSRIIALVSQKGGSGKATVSIQLAAGLTPRGYRVAAAAAQEEVEQLVSAVLEQLGE